MYEPGGTTDIMFCCPSSVLYHFFGAEPSFPRQSVLLESSVTRQEKAPKHPEPIAVNVPLMVM